MPRLDKEYSEYLKGNCENYNQPLISALEEMEKGGEGMDTFNEYSDEAKEIIDKFEFMLGEIEYDLLISFKDPYHDISRRFLNEIVGFEPLKEE